MTGRDSSCWEGSLVPGERRPYCGWRSNCSVPGSGWGIIANDQAAGLVDTAIMEKLNQSPSMRGDSRDTAAPAPVPVTEIPGECASAAGAGALWRRWGMGNVMISPPGQFPYSGSVCSSAYLLSSQDVAEPIPSDSRRSRNICTTAGGCENKKGFNFSSIRLLLSAISLRSASLSATVVPFLPYS